jgi:hypothetical protein
MTTNKGEKGGLFSSNKPSYLKMQLQRTENIKQQLDKIGSRLVTDWSVPREGLKRRMEAMNLGVFTPKPGSMSNVEIGNEIRQASSATINVDYNRYNEIVDFCKKSLERKNYEIIEPQERENKAREREKVLDYDTAISIWEGLGKPQEAARARKLKSEQSAINQTVVHGDYVDDRDTIVKDSVINRSNIGSGGDDKFSKLKELKEMLSEGLIDDDEFKQMKKEILGK